MVVLTTCAGASIVCVVSGTDRHITLGLRFPLAACRFHIILLLLPLGAVHGGVVEAGAGDAMLLPFHPLNAMVVGCCPLTPRLGRRRRLEPEVGIVHLPLSSFELAGISLIRLAYARRSPTLSCCFIATMVMYVWKHSIHCSPVVT